MKTRCIPGAVILFSAILVFCLIGGKCLAQATESTLCAQVKIHIAQELTFERQGFNATLGIANGMADTTLENISVTVNFWDKDQNPVSAGNDPNDPDALFFIRVDKLSNIDAIDGTGHVEPETGASVTWLIIPAPGAAGDLADGTAYYVGATLEYDIEGESQTTAVTPDRIYVRPTPDLTLDYFLPENVYGDDVNTVEIEPPTPFSLGLRVKNSGKATAYDLSVASAQPQIMENEQGLLVGFNIEGCEIDGGAAAPTLQANFGDLGADGVATARWTMTCSLSGDFVEFSADFSHADDLGGQLTSLVTGINTYTLIRDVLVDLPGRDDIRDFLAMDDDSGQPWVFESSGTDIAVADLSDSATFSALPAENQFRLTLPPTSQMILVTLDDPKTGEKAIRRVLRSDGKVMDSSDAWLSKTRNALEPWKYFFNLFDTGTTGIYTVVFGDRAQAASAPTLQHIPDKNALVQNQLSFVVTASDADGTTPALSAEPLPSGASFTDLQTGDGTFDWTPLPSQTGHYGITFTASDGLLEDSQFVTLNIYSDEDSDNDGIPDDYEMEKFQTLDRDGSGDFDGDGALDGQEFANCTDPTNCGPDAGLSGFPLQGFKPLQITFHDGSSSSDGIAGWLWRFGDGKTATAQNPSTTYETGGYYDVILSVTEFDGDTDSYTAMDYIRVNSIRNVCPASCEYFSIQTAIDESIQGDRVIVAPGQYPEDIDFSQNDISLENSDAAGTMSVAGQISISGGFLLIDKTWEIMGK